MENFCLGQSQKQRREKTSRSSERKRRDRDERGKGTVEGQLKRHLQGKRRSVKKLFGSSFNVFFSLSLSALFA